MSLHVRRQADLLAVRTTQPHHGLTLNSAFVHFHQAVAVGASDNHWTHRRSSYGVLMSIRDFILHTHFLRRAGCSSRPRSIQYPAGSVAGCDFPGYAPDRAPGRDRRNKSISHANSSVKCRTVLLRESLYPYCGSISDRGWFLQPQQPESSTG